MAYFHYSKIDFAKWMTKPELACILEIKEKEISYILDNFNLLERNIHGQLKPSKHAFRNNFAILVDFDGEFPQPRWNLRQTIKLLTSDLQVDGGIVSFPNFYFDRDKKKTYLKDSYRDSMNLIGKIAVLHTPITLPKVLDNNKSKVYFWNNSDYIKMSKVAMNWFNSFCYL
jgi:hypothetical protein